MKKILTLLLSLFIGTIVLTGCNNSSLDDEAKDTSQNIDSQVEAINLFDAFKFLNNSGSSYIKIRKEEGTNGSAPGGLRNIYYSEMASDIDELIAMLNQKANKIDEDPNPGGAYIEYRFYVDTKVYDEIYITDNMISYNGAHYSLTKPYDIELKNKGEQIYSLITLDNNSKAYKNNQYIMDFNKINELEFIKIEGTNKNYIVMLDCSLFKLYVISNNEFYMEDSNSSNKRSYYKIVGDIDFKELI